MQSKKRLLRSKVTIWSNGTLPLQALSLMTIWTQILDSLPLLTAQAICTKGSARLLGLNDLFAMTRDQDKMLMRHSSFLTSYAMSLMSELIVFSQLTQVFSAFFNHSLSSQLDVIPVPSPCWKNGNNGCIIQPCCCLIHSLKITKCIHSSLITVLSHKLPLRRAHANWPMVQRKATAPAGGAQHFQ